MNELTSILNVHHLAQKQNHLEATVIRNYGLLLIIGQYFVDLEHPYKLFQQVINENSVEMAKFLVQMDGISLNDTDHCEYETWQADDDMEWYKLTDPPSSMGVIGDDKYIDLCMAHSILHRAVGAGRLEICRLLFAHSNTKEKMANMLGGMFRTPIYRAVNNLEMCKLLIENGASVSTRDLNDKSALDFAVENNKIEVCQLFVDNDVDLGIAKLAMIKASYYGDYEIWKLLFDYVDDKMDEFAGNLKDAHDWTMLIYAVYRKHNKIALKLLEYSELDIDSQNIDLRSALHFAVGRGNVEMSKLLVERGADINLLDHEGDSPFSYSCEAGHLEICQYLARDGVNINVRNRDGLTPLGWAIEMGNDNVADFLRKLGAVE